MRKSGPGSVCPLGEAKQEGLGHFEDQTQPTSASPKSCILCPPGSGETVSGRERLCLVAETPREQERKTLSERQVCAGCPARPSSQGRHEGRELRALEGRGEMASRSSALDALLAPWAFQAPLQTQKQKLCLQMWK